MPTLRVRLPATTGRSYPIIYQSGLLEDLGDRVRAHPAGERYIIISDSTVAPLYADGARKSLRRAGLQADVISFKAGERNKTQRTVDRVIGRLQELGAGRDACILALGGGVTGDLAGFVAATYMRGIALVHMPTTVLAMVDSAIGGKTGVDTPAGKNLVGAFYQPRAIWGDIATLATLPAKHRRLGFAEVIKHGVIGDAQLFTRLETMGRDLMTVEPDGLAAIIAKAASVKVRVVEKDEKESGLRQVLNFGHTLGHALELLSQYRMAHGDAVAVGMVWEARLAENIGVARPGVSERIQDVLQTAGFRMKPPRAATVDAVLQATRLDKKARKGRVRYALPTRIGTMSRGDGRYSAAVPDREVRRVVREFLPA